MFIEHRRERRDFFSSSASQRHVGRVRIWHGGGSLRLRIGGLFRYTKAEGDLSAELEDYVAHETERYMASGLSREDARLAALRSTGGVEQVKEECRDACSSAWLERAVREFRKT